MIIDTELQKWLSEFREKTGRNLKILHVGNIAGNAFLNAKLMRRVGVEADVMCNDYYHIMGYPEWEELRINHHYGQDIMPRFSHDDILGYERPDWFAQGPLDLCISYLSAKNTADEKKEKVFKKKLNDFLFRGAEKSNPESKSPYNLLKRSLRIGRFLTKVMSRYINASYLTSVLNNRYRASFPKRHYRFKTKELFGYSHFKSKFQTLFSYYDIVQFYGTDPIFGLMFCKKPFVGFEHGTLRTFTSDDSFINALTALAYRNANHAFITNADCLEYAKNLEMQNYSAMIHPVDVEQHRVRDEFVIQNLRSQFAADVLLFCPMRHDWEIKGTDKHIRALPILNQVVSGKIVLVMANWGADLQKSKDLAKSMGVDHQIIWVAPMSRLKMIELIQASDVILEQTILPCFGSTAPQALACGVPTLMSYKPDVAAWIFDEPAPLIQAENEVEIADGVKLALDKDWLAEFKVKARLWVDRYHSSSLALNKQIGVYKNILSEQK
jgi:glycosyltransferase involved in cell wall biosynthesis